MRIVLKYLALLSLVFLLTGCQTKEGNEKVQLFLDWTPNTNHTGIYVAKEKGFFEEVGLDVEIMLPGEVCAEQIVGSGKGQFGISFQNQVTQARSEDLPIVSIAAIIQKNTGGYYTPKAKGIKTPKDFEGHKYGAYGSELEKASLQAVMNKEGGDASKIETVQVGNTDYFVALERDIDFVSIFYAWTGIEGEIRDADMHFIKTTDFAPELDTYSPLIITNDKMIEDNPDTVQAFINAVYKGYEFAIDNPQKSADILIAAEPDLQPELVRRSQEWLSPHYKEGAEAWGVQEASRWENFAEFMVKHQIIGEVDIQQAFTNEFIANAMK
ncbi:ABC transporter substrate-binding protein [Metasolibacillus fluoroglycofenilyticus]|uniref:ABC transporter substrate-binding protein n=1 Tax=Metasolibacillus fluoroglycofenilyticus TaxID=1239396 RepID=UPI000D34D7C9|nr:ABC transporter substrate-binding protein [Metasolibacillus fluoroglycofenilyticus]